MLKNKNFILTVILPIFVSIVIGIIVIVLNSQSVLKTQASAVVANEKRAMNSAMSGLKEEKKRLEKEAAQYDKTLEDNRLLLDEVNALTAELNDYTTAIEKAKETSVSLDTAISEKTAYNESLSAMSGNNTGGTKSYTNVKLKSPSDLKPGRYKAEGKGTLMLYTIAGTLQDKQNLALLDTQTYTFDIASGQSLKIEGTLSITEIIN